MNRHEKSQTISAREFNQHTGAAKKAADHGPVFITDRGTPAYVLMSHAEFERLTGQTTPPKKFVSLLEAIEQKGGPEYDFEFELPERRIEIFRNPFEDNE